jgi:predicted nucleic acid-binding protein
VLRTKEGLIHAAAQLRARFNLRPPDALHLACAQVHGCDALWTNDDRLVAASHGLAVNLLTAPS